MRPHYDPGGVGARYGDGTCRRYAPFEYASAPREPRAECAKQHSRAIRRRAAAKHINARSTPSGAGQSHPVQPLSTV